MRVLRWGMVCGIALLTGQVAYSHFQVILPTTDFVDAPGPVGLNLLFTHPMEQAPVMPMGTPKRFGVVLHGKRRDLLETLRPVTRDGKAAYKAAFEVQEPGDHVFFLEPAPYWEPAEGKMIVHYTKLVVNSMGEEDGWDRLVGLPVEIEPLVRPYGLWTGNLFRGVVRHNGKPVPFAEIEVEYWNEGKKVAVPTDAHVTQVIKADANGTFSYAMPRAGWWGFAALVEGESKMANPKGEPVPVELGALIWVKTTDMK